MGITRIRPYIAHGQYQNNALYRHGHYQNNALYLHGHYRNNGLHEVELRLLHSVKFDKSFLFYFIYCDTQPSIFWVSWEFFKKSNTRILKRKRLTSV
jgi:hypothetical protein